MMGLLKKIALLIVVLPLLSSCIREEEVFFGIQTDRLECHT